jgi:hypothetical protein
MVRGAWLGCLGRSDPKGLFGLWLVVGMGRRGAYMGACLPTYKKLVLCAGSVLYPMLLIDRRGLLCVYMPNPPAIDPPAQHTHTDDAMTYGSAVKLQHVESKYFLHSHQINWGSGSGQQSVTCESLSLCLLFGHDPNPLRP